MTILPTSCSHRWACLLKHQLSITVYRLPTKKNKLPLSDNVFSKQKKVCRFHFPFAANKWKLPFSVSSVFRLRNSRNMEMKTFRKQTWRHQTMSRRFFLICLPFAHRAKRTFFVCVFADEEKKRSYLFANELNGLSRLLYARYIVIIITYDAKKKR
jgi:hypothetical protein